MENLVQPLQVRAIRSPAELRQVAPEWDDLWSRSDETNPIGRAELVALRAEYLGSSLHALVVERAGHFVAALPLVNRRLKGMLNVGALPCNCWLTGGSLLLDPNTDDVAALTCLLSAVPRLPWPLLWLDQVSFDRGSWSALREAAERTGLSVSAREHSQIGEIGISHDWEAFKARMKGDHRRKLSRYVRKLDEAGGAELTLYSDMTPAQAEELTRRAFEIEDNSWKGSERSSLVKNPAIFEQYQREAQALARSGHLEIAFLEHLGRPMAFVFGYRAKGVFYSTKLGYDEAFAKFGPGQQLIFRLLERFHADPTRRVFDFAGPLVSFHQVWASRSYSVGPLVVAAPSLLGRSLFHMYTQWQPRAKRLQKSLAASVSSLRATASSATARLRRQTDPEST
jgi:CelD/BcsL family acetyltransferase involved in cellulose biosynthesis